MEDRVWHQSYVDGVPKSMDYEEITMPEILARTAQNFPNRTALWFMGRKISYAQLDRLVNRFANALKGLGVEPGDRVALFLPNIPQIVIGYFGLWRAGAVAAPNNPLYTDREIEHQLNDSGATVAVSLDLLTPRLLALRERTRIRRIISCHINDYLPFPARQLFPLVKKEMYRRFEKAPDFYQFLDLIKSAPDTPSGHKPNMDDLAVIPYTGGTTGVAKGVRITHRNASCKTQMGQAWFFDLKEKPIVELGVFPMFHLSGFTGLMNLCVANGWTNLLVPRPEPQTVLEFILKYKPDVIPAVPTIFVGLLNLPGFHQADLSFVKGFFSGAAPLPLDTINKLKEATGGSIVEVWGMTESTGLVTVTPWRGRLKPGSAGVPLPDTDLRVVDVETGTRDLAAGEEGELIFRGPQMCQGYYNRPEETANAIRDGWFYTGDIGRLDEDGYVYIVDRKKDMIIASGFNIYPNEIDEVLYEHPQVLEACVVGVPHDYRGETVKAFVVPKPGQKPTKDELDAFCRERLTAYKVPKIYEFMDELPKSAVGKILRRELRAMEIEKAKGRPADG
ncbi:MAG: long-chain fatty acid--CoA ligase [Proteobacteria bacterium]|nr:long-chain fatty acid--CoA ligase [Pseudomonadota bacterium]